MKIIKKSWIGGRIVPPFFVRKKLGNRKEIDRFYS